MIYDFIIVGQGIAGTVLSWTLMQQGKKVLVVDNHKKPSSSEIAMGIYNPMVFKRMTKSWKADLLIPFAENTYTELEKVLGISFLHKTTVMKYFSSADENTFWKKKMHNGEASDFMAAPLETATHADFILADNGSADVLQSGWVDTSVFLNAYQQYLKENELLSEKEFQYEQLDLSGENVQWESISASKIIFCEGSKAVVNPFFKYLPFVLTKGEMLTIRIKNFSPGNIINKGIYLLHEHDDIFKVGATYEWDDLTDTPTEKGKEELLEKLNKILKCDYEILDQSAAIRPTVKDRRPLIGLHPKDKRIGIFNGMGTKGVMIAPFFAMHFAEYLESDLPLDKEVDIKRFNN